MPAAAQGRSATNSPGLAVVAETGRRPPAGSVWPVHQVQPVRLGRAEHRAVIAVADGEGVGQGAVERDVVPLEVRHRVLARDAIGGQVRGHEPVHLAVVIRIVLRTPAVTVGGQILCAGAVGVGVEGEQVLVGVVRVVLVEPALRHARVGEAAHAGHGAEVVVEGAVLLHQHDDVLYPGDGRAGQARGARRGRGIVEDLPQAGRQGEGRQHHSARRRHQLAPTHLNRHVGASFAGAAT